MNNNEIKKDLEDLDKAIKIIDPDEKVFERTSNIIKNNKKI